MDRGVKKQSVLVFKQRFMFRQYQERCDAVLLIEQI